MQVPQDGDGMSSAMAFHSSKSNEWYTPSHIIESARAVMGGIDLDPASCELANRTVKSASYYSKDVDGLYHPWHGRVWLNPPYGRVASVFVNQLLSYKTLGYVEQAVLILNQNSMSSLWFDPIYASFDAMSVTRGRLSFTSRDGSIPSSPSTGSVIIYFGPNVDAFATEFSKHGNILRPWGR